MKHIKIFEDFTVENMECEYPENVIEDTAVAEQETETGYKFEDDDLDLESCDITYNPACKMSKEEYEKCSIGEKQLICKAIELANEA